MSHPPIPPECEFFYFNNKGEAVFTVGESYSLDYEINMRLIKADGFIKEVIAAVAAEYWRREFERRKKEIVQSPWDARLKTTNHANDAKRTMEAWQEWGMLQ